MMMILKNAGERVDVYGIKYDSSGFPHFLIYKEGRWEIKSAKHFRPPDANDFSKLVKDAMSMPISPLKEDESNVYYTG